MPTPLPTIAGVARATFRGLMPSGRQWANVLHFRYANGASTPGPTEIAALDALAVRLYTGAAFGAGLNWFTYCRASVTMIDATYYPLDGLSPPTTIIHTATAAGATNQLPSECAHVVTLRTAKRGRSYRGRAYLPAAMQANVGTDGTLSSTAVTATLAQWTGLQAALATPLWELGVASYLHSTWEKATGFTMDAKVDVQRRRK